MPGRFIDTNVLLYLLSGDRAKADVAEGLLREGGTVSVQVLNEIASVTQRKLMMSWAQSDEFLLMIREFVTVEPLTYETHDLGIALARPGETNDQYRNRVSLAWASREQGAGGQGGSHGTA